jgi:hypothetical protein
MSVSPALVEELRADGHDAHGPQVSLMEFVRKAWPILEPDRAFVSNWHVEALMAHFEAVTDGRILARETGGRRRRSTVSTRMMALEQKPMCYRHWRRYWPIV